MSTSKGSPSTVMLGMSVPLKVITTVRVLVTSPLGPLMTLIVMSRVIVPDNGHDSSVRGTGCKTSTMVEVLIMS